jgi:hypothetical protein
MSYITAIMEGDEEPMDDLGRKAVIAFGHMVDETATLEDLDNYRAWLTWLRLTDVSEADLKTSVGLAEALARKLGVA